MVNEWKGKRDILQIRKIKIFLHVCNNECISIQHILLDIILES